METKKRLEKEPELSSEKENDGAVEKEKISNDGGNLLLYNWKAKLRFWKILASLVIAVGTHLVADTPLAPLPLVESLLLAISVIALDALFAFAIISGYFYLIRKRLFNAARIEEYSKQKPEMVYRILKQKMLSHLVFITVVILVLINFL